VLSELSQKQTSTFFYKWELNWYLFYIEVFHHFTVTSRNIAVHTEVRVAHCPFAAAVRLMVNVPWSS
jgi:hypothetical protein